MKLVSFAIKNYRSIVKTETLKFSDLTVLVGPNNEGKSNVLKALVTALKIVTESRPVRRYSRYNLDSIDEFDWDRDFPVHLRSESVQGTCTFTLEFELSDSERETFWHDVGNALSGNLKIRLELGGRKENKYAKFEVLIQGPSKKVLSAKQPAIADFVKNHLEIVYIPAVRTAENINEVVERMLLRSLKSLDENDEYKTLLHKIQQIREPALAEVSQSLQKSLATMLTVDNVRITETGGTTVGNIRSPRFQVFVDDGTAETELELKGDGIISLAAIALVRQSSLQEIAQKKSLILAIEEPESHLHSRVIRHLREAITETSKYCQTVITTHSPLLVDRENVQNNIIVKSSGAHPVANLAEIRDALGVTLSDNLMNAYMVLLVEGESDRRILETWLTISERLKHAMRQKMLVIQPLVGAANLPYQAQVYKTSLYNVHAFLDNDEPGRLAIDQALEQTVLEKSECTLAHVPGLKDSEIEDLVDEKIYQTDLEKWGVLLSDKVFRKGKQKWSERLKCTFVNQGKPWNETILKDAKVLVADSVTRNPADSLEPHKRQVVDALIAALESKLAIVAAK